MEGFHRRLELADDIQQLASLAKRQRWEHDLNFEQQLVWENKTILVTDPRQNIVYASSNIFHMNGYLPEEVVGKRPSLFQGPETSEEIKAQLRAALQQAMPFEADIINYRKNGDKYVCRVSEYPLFNQQKELVNFIAFECLA